MHITMTASILGSSMRGRHMCMHTGRVHRVHTPRRCMPVLCAIADPTRRPPPVSTLKDPAHIGARTTKNATVAEDTQHTLDEYMRLPVEQYYELDPAMIKPLGGDCFQLAVPRIQLFNVWLEPVVQVHVQQAPGKVIIEATECTLNGSDIVASLNQRFEMRFTTILTWDSPASSSTSTTAIPVALQPQQQRAPTRGTIFADLDLHVWCEVIPPFNLLPRQGVLEPTANTVLGTLVNGLLPVFVRKLGADYERWAMDDGYRDRRAALSSAGMVEETPAGSNIVKRTLTDKDIPLAPPTPQQEKVAPASITIDDALRAEMVGWEVRMLPSNAPLGLVTEVVASMEDIGQHLLRVTRSVASAPIGTHGIDATNQAWDALLASGLEEQHLIPLVPAIVPRIDRAARCLYIDPPSGLLDLGRKQVLLAYLKTALQPFTSQSPSVSEQLAGIRVMPTRKQLLDAGRRDLINIISVCGGMTEVALLLGLRAARRPTGYWDNIDNLDQELTLFVAANWTKFNDPELPNEYYWYNQLTGKLSWVEPSPVEKLPLADDGSYVLIEDEEDRVMPSRQQLFAAGRYDIHHAVRYLGGYREVAHALDRRPTWPRRPALRHDFKALAAELQVFVEEMELPEKVMPSSQRLLEEERGDIVSGIAAFGGYRAVAQRMGWSMTRKAKGFWKSLDDVVPCFVEVAMILAKQQQEQEQQGEGEEQQQEQVQQEQRQEDEEGKEQQQQQLGTTELGKKQQDEQQLAMPKQQLAMPKQQLAMPSRAQLRSLGRNDLLYVLAKYSIVEVAQAAGLRMTEHQQRMAWRHRNAAAKGTTIRGSTTKGGPSAVYVSS